MKCVPYLEHIFEYIQPKIKKKKNNIYIFQRN